MDVLEDDLDRRYSLEEKSGRFHFIDDVQSNFSLRPEIMTPVTGANNVCVSFHMQIEN